MLRTGPLNSAFCLNSDTETFPFCFRRRLTTFLYDNIIDVRELLFLKSPSLISQNILWQSPSVEKCCGMIFIQYPSHTGDDSLLFHKASVGWGRYSFSPWESRSRGSCPVTCSRPLQSPREVVLGQPEQQFNTQMFYVLNLCWVSTGTKKLLTTNVARWL